ncbi:ABC transporter permease [Mucilaginibacter sp.]|uniref:ABC transporter permease n=1 Tax=Mucilaginibacter sp. TaxID=1882438 RepID=UPI0025F75B9F|nr:ABC transporter permease [Mucilaginibacter sp.]
MIKNYIKIAWRNIVNNKVYSALNIVGLAAGMAVALLIALWVNYQYSFDKFLPDYEHAYQVRRNFNSNGDTLTFGSTSLKLAAVLRSQVPGFAQVAESDFGSSHGLMVGAKKLLLNGQQVGSGFMEIFKFKVINGAAKNALVDPLSIVLTESTAKSLFGDENPINKVVRVDNRDNLKVTAVIQNLPANSSFQFKYLLPFSYLVQVEALQSQYGGSFGNNGYQLFAALKPGVTYSKVAVKIKDIEKTQTDNINAMSSSVIMQPIADWHLYGSYKNGKAVDGFIEYVRIFGIVGILVLLIACINFVNLSTARSEKRAREVGVRKAIGSGRRDLIFQFLTESAVLTFLSFVLGVVLVDICLPAFNALAGTVINIPFASGWFWLTVFCGILLTSVIAGSRPAFYLSSFNPVKVLKGTFRAPKSAAFSRRILVVAQFSCSIMLIISTVIIYRQVEYARNRPTGYDISRVITSGMNNNLYSNYEALKHELLQNGVVSSIAMASSPATDIDSHMDLDYFQGKRPGETVEMGRISVAPDYFKTLGMKIVAGRGFINGAKSDSSALLLNEAAVKRLRLANPLGEKIVKNGMTYRVIGVVKDALMSSPYAAADPTMFQLGGGDNLLYKLSPNVPPHEAITKLTDIFNKFSPAYPYDYRFVDNEYNRKFNEEELVGKLVGVFAALAIFISCLGLFGLAAFVAEQRTKEIGVRKVLGATVTQVWMLLSKDFVVLVVISCVIASPIALYFLQKWLMKYDYRITIGPGVFIISAIVAIVITLLTISTQAIKAALANPVKSLKNE